MKKILSIILSISMLLSIGTVLATPIDVNAVSKRTKAVRAYKKFLKQNESSYGDYSLIYLDNDKVPELVTMENYFAVVYTYTGGKIKSISGQIDLGYTNNKFKYYKKTGVYSSTRMRNGIIGTDYYKLSKGNGKNIGYKYKDTNDYPNEKTKYYKYSNNGKSIKVSKAKFKKWFKKVTKNKKTKSAKFYSNTKSGRKHCK